MKCNKCGLNNNEGNTKCSNCGNILVDNKQLNNNNLNQSINNTNQARLVVIILGILLIVFAITIGYYIFKSTYGNDISPSKEQENNMEDVNDTIALKLVDPSTETFTGCPSSINESKYLKQSSYGYFGYLSASNVKAAITEYMSCDYASYTTYDNAIQYSLNVYFGKHNAIHNFALSNYGYGVVANYYQSGSESKIVFPSFYTFNNNDYLVVTQSSTNTTGPAIDDGIYIYDESGKNIFKLEDITLDIYDENDNLKNGVRYTKICQDAWFYEDCETITYGEIRYDPKTKEFVNITEEKSIDEYCSENYCS